jgi:DnaJ-class molecular chaperone
MSNFYEILGVDKEANESEIKKAYRLLSLKCHPDRGGDTKRFQEINEAYGTLSDPDKKQQYDAQLNGGIHFTHMQGGDDFGDINNIFSMFFGGGMPGMHPGMHGMQGMPGMPDIHVFHSGGPFPGGGGPFPGGGGPFPGGGPFTGGGGIFHNLQRPPPIIKNIKITMEQAYQGYSFPLEIERWVIQNNIKINEIETIYISIPQGADENELIIMRERGHVINDNCKGDIKICIQIENNTQFKRHGLDILFKKTISLKESLCGFSFEIQHLNGKQLCLNNNTNKTIIHPNYKKIIPGLGFVRENNVGSMIIEFDIQFPDSLTEEQMSQIMDIL